MIIEIGGQDQENGQGPQGIVTEPSSEQDRHMTPTGESKDVVTRQQQSRETETENATVEGDAIRDNTLVQKHVELPDQNPYNETQSMAYKMASLSMESDRKDMTPDHKDAGKSQRDAEAKREETRLSPKF
jgi:hypothetical protein